MPDFEDAFRQGFGRIDAIPSPLPPLDGAELAARAAAEQRPRRPRFNPARLLTAAAAVLLAIGAPVAIWLSWGAPQRPIPAEPAPAPSGAHTVIPPLARTPSAYEVLLDDPGLIHHEIAGEGGVPSGFFVSGDTITVPDEHQERQVLSAYRGGELIDRLTLPYVPYGQFASWDGTYYLLGETLRAFTRQGDALVEVSLPDELVGAGAFDGLVVEGENLVALRAGKHHLVAGPGPLVDAPRLDIVDDGFTIADGALDVHLQASEEPSGVFLLGRDAGHVWYAAFDGGGGFVYEFTAQGRLAASYTLDPRVTSGQVQVAGGRVYALVIVEDAAEPVNDTVQVWELTPNPLVR